MYFEGFGAVGECISILWPQKLGDLFMSCEVSPVYILKKFCFISVIKVEHTWEKQVAWRYYASSMFTFFLWMMTAREGLDLWRGVAWYDVISFLCCVAKV